MVPLEREPVEVWRFAEACRVMVLAEGWLGELVELQWLAEVQLVEMVVPQVVGGW